MLSHALHLSLLHLLLTLPTALTADDPPPYTADDLILLNCGGQNAPDSAGRSWDSDNRSRYSPANTDGISSAVKAETMALVANPIPYSTARVIHSRFSYSFPVLRGHKFVRLYFNPATYIDEATNTKFDASQSFFSVTANNYTLLSNFSASLNSQDSQDDPSFVKEFLILVNGDQRIDLTFTPNPNSTAFINGIEIVSLPDQLYFRSGQIKFENQVYYLQNGAAFETLYRLNVGGGKDVDIQDDSGSTRGMFRRWTDDADYINSADSGFTPNSDNHSIRYTPETPSYSAPKIVYRTSRTLSNTSIDLRWSFPVDSGFYYMLRLHFCEIQLEVTLENQRVFDIKISNETVEPQADIIGWTRSVGVPMFKDYVAYVPDDGRRGKQDLWLSLVPNMDSRPKYRNVLLNGLEIFKLSDANGSLAVANPEPRETSSPLAPPAPPLHKKKGMSSVVYAAIGSVIGVIAVITVLSFLIFRWRRLKVKDSVTTKSSWMPLPTPSRSTTRTSGSGVPLPSDRCRHFSLEEIRVATKSFDPNFIIGKGGFGNVYKGLIDNAATTVAVKRLNATSSQGAREFRTEIEMLSRLRHVHLVSLIGYCDDNGEMILVYDYMAHGTLRDHLYNSDSSPLKWKQRLQICLGAAKGLHYLHTGAKNKIIHRDVKSTNILLDEKWVAKVSDFGLSKVGHGDDANTHVSTAVKGSIGYVDPEYFRRQQLTEKSDVYSFGVVLLEVLCARPVILPSLPREKVNLAEWVKLCHRKGTVEKIIDSNLKNQIAPECLNKFIETAILCLQDKGIERPTMSDVVWRLDFALDLQETAEVDGASSFVSPSPSPSDAIKKREEDGYTTEEEAMFSSNSETATWSKSSGLPSGSNKMNPGDVFSQLVNPSGR